MPGLCGSHSSQGLCHVVSVSASRCSSSLVSGFAIVGIRFLRGKHRNQGFLPAKPAKNWSVVIEPGTHPPNSNGTYNGYYQPISFHTVHIHRYRCTHTHTRMYVYIHIYVCVCVCCMYVYAGSTIYELVIAVSCAFGPKDLMS